MCGLHQLDNNNDILVENAKNEVAIQNHYFTLKFQWAVVFLYNYKIVFASWPSLKTAYDDFEFSLFLPTATVAIFTLTQSMNYDDFTILYSHNN